jgi:O-antigen/teichoic acid export membrane protein
MHDMNTASASVPRPLLGGRIQWGALWMIFNTGSSKLLGFIAQMVMGWLISQDDFALYAIAISVSSFTVLLSDAGVRNLLIQRHREYDHLEGTVFWLSLALNASACGVLAGFAPLVAHAYREPALLGILLLIAFSTFLATPATMFSARLRIDLRFKELSLVQIGSSCIRYGGMVGLAWLGFGPMSFVLPVVFVNVYEAVATWALARTAPWRRPPGLERWRALLHETKWIVLGSFSLGLLNNGLYLALGSFMPKTVLGVYFFAYQIVVQIGALLSTNLFQVLFPAFSQLAHDPVRYRAAVERALSAVMFVAAFSCILIPTYGPLEQLIWKGKWAETVWPVQILCIFYPISVSLSVTMAVQAARGEFRMSALLTLALAVGTVGAGLAGGFLTGAPYGIALSSGLVIFVGSVIYLVVTLRLGALAVGSVLRSILTIWLIGLSSAAIAFGVVAASSWPAELEIGFGGLTFLITFVVAVRLCVPERLRESAAMIPANFRAPVLNLLRLSAEGHPA